MRVALVIHDDNGSVEVASMDCITFVGGCAGLNNCMSSALYHFAHGHVSTAAVMNEQTRNILTTLGRMGTLEDLPVVHSC